MSNFQTLLEKDTQTSWLSDGCEELKYIPIINFDVLPMLCGCDNLTSCDGLLYDFSNTRKFSLLMEFKNCDRKVRHFSIFSAQDFKNLVNSEYFQSWNWGEYSKYIKLNVGKEY
jgi:hypothetical protein